MCYISIIDTLPVGTNVFTLQSFNYFTILRPRDTNFISHFIIIIIDDDIDCIFNDCEMMGDDTEAPTQYNVCLYML